jgi:alkylation response protein AidB-like acyl-CoA dehydrogenase
MQHSFFLGEDQRIFRESLTRWLQGNWSPAERRKHGIKDPGFSTAAWKALAEMGVLGAFLPEEVGGAGGGGLELMIAMEALGRALFASPFLWTVPLAGALLAAGGARGRGMLGRIAAGEAIVAVALSETRGRYDLQHVETRAQRQGDTYRLSGIKPAVAYGAAADWIIVPARTAGEARSSHGISLFLLETGHPGMALRSYATADGGRAADMELREVAVSAAEVLGEPGHGFDLLERAVDLAILAQCAEAVGAMRKLQESTVAYAKTREQFGATLASFQSLQHRMVDMFAAAETSASRVQAALARIAGPESAIDSRDSILTKLYVDKAARLVAQEAVQIHGGMGMTDDLDVGHYFKRLTMMALTFADQGKLDERYRDLQGTRGERP